jgi:hypothetical protein
MPTILFKLRDVPNDEADEIRELLTKNNIKYYETPPSMWGISAGAIWLKDEHQLENAKGLIEKYQRDRSIKIREEYEQLKREGKAKTIMDIIKERPVQFIVYIALLLFILYVSIKPFLNFGK